MKSSKASPRPYESPLGLLRVALISAGICFHMVGETKAQPVPITFSNDTGMSASQIFIQFLGGQPVNGYFVDAFGSNQTLQANTSYSLDQLRNPTTGQSQIFVTDYSGRIYMNYGPYGLQNLGADGGGYTPAAANPGDPNYNTRYQYWEATIVPETAGGSTIYADLSYIDFTAISFSMAARYTSNSTVNSTVQNGNQVSSNTQVLVNATVASSQNSTLAVLPQGASTTLPNQEFTRVISPQFSANGTYHDFTDYINALGSNSTSVTLAGVFVGTGPQPSGSPATQGQTYNFTGNFTGNATSGQIVLQAQSNSGNSTSGPTQPGVGSNATITISNVNLNSQNGIYGNNVVYTVSDSSGNYTTTGITNDVYGRVVGDLLAGLSFGYVGSTVEFNGTPIGQLSSTEWWAGGETGGPVPMPDGSTVNWADTPAGQGIYFSGAQPDQPLFYNGYAASLVPYTPAYGFPLQDRLGNNLLVYNTAATPNTFLNISVNPDGTSALPTGIWSGNATNGEWGDAANWLGNAVPGGNASVQFVGNHTQTTTVDTGTDRSTTGIYFNYAAGNFTIANNTITLSGDVVNSSNKTQTINSDLTLGSDSTATAAFGDLVFGGDIALSNNATANTLTFAGTENSTVTGNITDGTAAGGIVAKTGTGTLTLSGNNSFTGGLDHGSGTLILGSNQAAGTGLLTLGSAAMPDAVLQATGGNTTLSNAIAIEGNTTISGSNGFDFTGPVTLTASTIPLGNSTTTFQDFTITNTVDVEFSGAIGESVAGSSLTKAGNGTMTFSGNSSNTFTGTLAVNEGVLNLNKSSGLAYSGNLSIGDGTGGNASVVLLSNNQTASTNLSIDTDGQLDLQSFNTTIGNLTMTGGSIQGNGTLSVATGSTIQFSGLGASTAEIAANVNMGNGTTTLVAFNNEAATELTISGNLSGSGSITKGESGTVALTGTNNTFNGTITVAGGVVETSSINATVNLTNGALSPGGSGQTSSITLNQLASSSSNSTAGGLLMDLGDSNASDLITVNTNSGINLGNGTVFLFSSANFTAGSGNFTLVSGGSGGSGSWASTPSISSFTFASIDIAGLTGYFSYGSGNLTFNALAGQTSTWNGSSGNGSWTTNENWVGNAVPLAGADIVFTGANGTVSTGSNQTTGAITFDSGASAFIISNNTITLGGNLINNSTANQTINSDISINANRVIAANSGNFVINGDVNLSSNAMLPGRLTFSGDQNTSVNGTISDGPAAGGSLLKTGNGTLTLTGNNTFTGSVTIAGGVLEADSAGALGDTPQTVTTNTLVFDGGTLRAIANINDGPPSQRKVRLLGDGTYDTNGNTITVGGPIEGQGNLTKTGAGELIFVQNGPNPNSYSGQTFVNEGILSLTYNGALGTTDGGTTVSGNGSLSINGTFSISGEALTLSGNGSGNGALAAASGQSTWNSTVTLADDASIQASNNATLILSRTVSIGNNTLSVGGDSGTVNLTGNLEGSGGLVKIGNGTVAVGSQTATGISGPGNNLNFTGPTTVQDGTLNVLNAYALGNGTSAVTVDSGATLQFTSQGNMTVNFPSLTLNGTGANGLGALYNTTSAVTTVAGPVSLTGDTFIKSLTGQLVLDGDVSLGNSTLTTETSSAPIVISGDISGGGGITTNSTGTLQLSGNNTYSGTTTVGGGTTLTISSNNALGTAAAGTTVATGAFLQLSGGINVVSESLALNGTLINLSGNNTFGGDIALTTTTTLQSNGGVMTLSGNVTGAQNLLIQGEGAVYLSNSSYNGAQVAVNSGTFASGNLTSTIVVLGPYTGPGTGAPTYSPGQVGQIATVNLQNVISTNGTFLMDLGAGSTSDTIVTSAGPSISGNTAFVFNNAGYAGGGGNFTLINAPSAGIGGTATYSFTSNIAGLSGSITQSAGAPGTVTFQAFASTAIWNNSSSNNQWDTGANWDVGVTPTSGSAVAFNTANSTTVDTQINRLVGGLEFQSGSAALTIGNNTITTYGDIVNNSSATQTISSSLALLEDINVAANSGNLAITGPVALSSGPFGTPGRTLTFSGNQNTVVSGPISNGNATSAAVVKTGNGTVTLQGNHTYTGTTTISAGTFMVDGQTASGNHFQVDQGGTLGGSGTILGSVVVAGTISPGNSPGILSTGSETWLDDGNYNWQILDGNGTAGTGYDTVSITGTLDLTGLSTGGFAINMWSLSSIGPDVNGNALNFNAASSQGWTLASTTAGIVGFQASDFVVNVAAANGTAGFSNPINGSFSVSVSGNNLLLNYTPIPEPTTCLLLISAGATLWLGRRRVRKNS